MRVRQSEDSGAVCGNSEPAEGSKAADRPDARLRCPLQSAQGTAPQRHVPHTKVQPVRVHVSDQLVQQDIFFQNELVCTFLY